MSEDSTQARREFSERLGAFVQPIPVPARYSSGIQTKDDVEFHSDHGSGGQPAVNVKVYSSIWDVPLPLEFGQVKEQGETVWQDVTSDPGFTHDWVREHLSDEELNVWYEAAVESCWEQAQTVAEEVYGAGVKVYSQGRSGGWAVVDGINNDVDSWDAVDLAKWRSFATKMREVADDLPRCMLDLIYANVYTPTIELSEPLLGELSEPADPAAAAGDGEIEQSL